MNRLLCVFLWAGVQNANGQIVIQAPDEVSAGAAFEVTWSGGSSKKEFVTIVSQDTPAGKYDRYQYNSQQKWSALAPEVPGKYEIRYLSGESGYPTLAAKPLLVVPVTASLSTQTPVAAGSEMTVQWEGPNNPRDFITVVAKGAAERTYKDYQYTSRGNPVKLRAPDTAGTYEIRYLTGQKYLTLASMTIEVTATSASLTAPNTALAGGEVVIHWEGPDNRGDYITIVEKDAGPKRYGKYAYTHIGNPISLLAPDQPGTYEIRYNTEGSNTLSAIPLEVTASSATLQFAKQVTAGSPVEIRWSGPDNPRDFITIVAADAPERSYEKYRFTSKGNPVSLPAPDQPGRYEVRYATGQTYATLAAEPLVVTAVSASLQAPGQVEAGSYFEVSWEGPGNDRDFIAVAPMGSDAKTWPSYRFVHLGNPLRLHAPSEPGNYELRYQTGQSYLVLATRALQVAPAAERPGFIQVVSSSKTAGVGSEDAIELILDASGSMLQRLDGKRRIDIAKQVLISLVDETIPEGTLLAMRVFGHREADTCRTDLELTLAPLTRSQAKQKIQTIEAMNLAKTPIADSLALVAQDLSGVSGQRTVILLTDGEETCGGDPAATIRALRAAGMDVRVNIVGFAIDSAELRQEFEFWAGVSGGAFFDAKNAGELSLSMVQATRRPFEVLDQSGQKVAGGFENGDRVEVPVGTYRVTIGSFSQEVYVTGDDIVTINAK
ncbi:MAG: VWA domain-containing protein [Acidobacteria bacterium]|nr:VWA domain-containing protein [Acidobacteriota bacterium]